MGAVKSMTAAVLALGIGACSQPAPSAPAPPQAVVSPNQAPQIVAGAVSPALGIDEVTTFTVRVEVLDPDADQVSLRVSGCSFGQDAPVSLDNGAATLSFKGTRYCALNLTATDARGATAQTRIPFIHTGFFGPYRLVIGQGFYSSPYFWVTLKQSGAVITGTISDHRGHKGTTDPHEPGTVDAEGRFRLRFKIQSEGDFVITGRVISANDAVYHDVIVGTGTVIDGLHQGQTFQLWREAMY